MRQEIDAVAREAARAASLQSSLTAGQRAADTTADSFAADRGVTCMEMTVVVTGDYAAPAGTSAAVRVQVSCTASLADLALPGLPGSRTLHADYRAVLDTYSTRSQP